MKRKFWVVDYYEGYEIIGTTNDLAEAKKMMNERIDDTDGECDVEIIDATK